MTPIAPRPLADADIARLESLLDALPAPLQPLDVSAVDGLLCGVLVQPQRVAEASWLARVRDIDGRDPPAGVGLDELHALLRRRHAEIDRAIELRQWFDPWIFQLDDAATPSDSVLPWVAGFAAAMEAFPAAMALNEPGLVEPMALLYLHFDPDDLDDAQALLEFIAGIEPPGDLAEAVQDVVRALMLIADVTRPRAAAPRRGAGRQLPPRPGPARRR